MAASLGNSNVSDVTEYNFDKETFALMNTQQLLPTVPYELATNNFIDFTAGRNKDQFTVVYIECSDLCEVWNVFILSICAIFNLLKISIVTAEYKQKVACTLY